MDKKGAILEISGNILKKTGSCNIEVGLQPAIFLIADFSEKTVPHEDDYAVFRPRGQRAVSAEAGVVGLSGGDDGAPKGPPL